MRSRPRPRRRHHPGQSPSSHGSRGRRRRVAGTIVGSVTALGATTLVGQDPGPLVTDRPDQTESAQSMAAGLFQLEVGWTYTLEREDARVVRSHAVPGALVRIGLGSGLEVRVGFAGWITRHEEVTDPLADPLPGPSADPSPDGAGDADLGLKWEFPPPWGEGTRLALLGGFTLPIGRAGVGSERVDPSVRIAASNDLGDQVSLGYNVGFRWETIETVRESLDTQADLLYTVALGLGLSDRVGAFLESFGFFGLAGGRPDRHSMDGGLTVLLSDALQLDTSAGVGINEAAEDWFVAAGASVRFPR